MRVSTMIAFVVAATLILAGAHAATFPTCSWSSDEATCEMHGLLTAIRVHAPAIGPLWARAQRTCQVAVVVVLNQLGHRP